MTAYKAPRPDMPAVSQPMPLDDFPPFTSDAREPRALTCGESRELVLREHVRQRRAHSIVGRSFKRFVVGAVVAAFCLPTVERLVLHLDTGAAPSAVVQSS